MSSQDDRSVAARFGVLAKKGWGVVLPAARRYRTSLGLGAAEQLVLEQLLYHHRSRFDWISLDQPRLARELGVDRTTVRDQLRRLRRTGLVLVKHDLRFGTFPKAASSRHTAPLFYSLEPYLGAVCWWSQAEEPDTAREALGKQSMEHVRRARAQAEDDWVWELENEVSTRRGAAALEAAFMLRYLRSVPSRSHTALAA